MKSKLSQQFSASHSLRQSLFTITGKADPICRTLKSALAVLLVSMTISPMTALADMEEADSLAEEQVKEKEELKDMQNELNDIKGNISGALGELSDLTKKMANQANAKEFHLFARETGWDTYSGSNVHCLSYNGKIPGPPIVIQEGELAKIVLHNQMKVSTSLQFHGIVVPHTVGGIPRSGQGLVEPGQTFVFQFVARQPGTFWYHPQLIHPNQKQLGLYGPIVVQPRLKSRPYDKDVTLIFSELRKSPQAVPANVAGKVTPLKAGQAKVKAATPEESAEGDQQKSNFRAVAWTDGATPPDVETDYLINGKPAPTVPAIELRKGERVKLRLINAGQEIVPLQLGGHRMEVVAVNGGDRLEPHVFRDTLTLNPSDRVDVEFTADNPGVWSLCSESAHQSSRKGRFPGGMALVVRYSELRARQQQPQQE